ncbi:ATP-binding cassette domain-containing protein, partial [Pseudomonas aeruginosa]|uniref:ATP-binding cassette domain-containing protein n=1 Tax=Pseudomonas aeruginosa TaxID=287 RepID=UPI003896ADE0
GRDLFSMKERDRADIRGNQLAMIFQEPMTSLNPAFTIGHQIAEGVRRHSKVSKTEARAQALRMLELVRIPAPEKRLDAFPHQLSGGMRQRVAIARVLALDSPIMLMDEPFGALDALTLRNLQDELLKIWKVFGTTIVFVTHSIEESIYLADRTIVMTYRPGTIKRDV